MTTFVPKISKLGGVFLEYKCKFCREKYHSNAIYTSFISSDKIVSA